MPEHKDTIPVIKPPRAHRRQRTGISSKQAREAINVLRDGMEPQVTFNYDALKMAHQAVEHCRAAMMRAMEILGSKK